MKSAKRAKEISVGAAPTRECSKLHWPRPKLGRVVKKRIANWNSKTPTKFEICIFQFSMLCFSRLITKNLSIIGERHATTATDATATFADAAKKEKDSRAASCEWRRADGRNRSR